MLIDLQKLEKFDPEKLRKQFAVYITKTTTLNDKAVSSPIDIFTVPKGFTFFATGLGITISNLNDFTGGDKTLAFYPDVTCQLLIDGKVHPYYQIDILTRNVGTNQPTEYRDILKENQHLEVFIFSAGGSGKSTYSLITLTGVLVQNF